MNFEKNIQIGVIGSGAMGCGIAQVAATAGHIVIVYDNNSTALNKAKISLTAILLKLKERGKIKSASIILDNIYFVNSLTELASCSLIIEAIVEQLEIKKAVFKELESIVADSCILATNTSSLSVTSIAAACTKPERVIGVHFFNPAPLMTLVEIVPAIQTNYSLIQTVKELMVLWGKTVVIAQDTPGFIVNRLARPFYGEAIRILEEGLASVVTIDWAMTEIGGFKMGPFALMDFIGHDVNYVVTETVFKSFFYDPRYKPSFTQKRLLEAGWLGRKSGKGFYNYADSNTDQKPDKDLKLGKQIFERILSMLINEAVDAFYLNIATAEDIETAMAQGANYPKGLLHWCDDWGADNCLSRIDRLYNVYHEDRYRASFLLRKYAFDNKKFFV